MDKEHITLYIKSNITKSDWQKNVFIHTLILTKQQFKQHKLFFGNLITLKRQEIIELKKCKIRDKETAHIVCVTVGD